MRDNEAAELLDDLPPRQRAEVLDVYSAVTVLMAARDDTDKTYTAIAASMTQFCEKHLIVGLAMVAGEFVKLLAEGTGRSVEDVVRQNLAARHTDPVDMEMFDIIIGVADSGVLPEGLQS
jgi:hypothetical protein